MSEAMTLAQARAVWWEKQALSGSAKGTIANVLGSSGWLRTLGGIDVYLAARGRRPGMKRSELDAAISDGSLRIMPAARGCMYVVPAAVVADLRALNAVEWRKTTEKELGKIGRTIADVEALAKPVLAALKDALTTDALRKALPAGAIPSFGDAGKKIGLSSPLPLVLRLLELDGRIERTLEGGKLDSDRYLWRKASWKVPAGAKDHDSQLANFVGAFLAFAGPVTVGQIAKWSGLAQRDVKPALEKLGARTVTIEGIGEAYVRAEDVAALKKAPTPSGAALLAFEDNYLVNHGGLAPVSDPKHHNISVDIFGGEKPETIGEADHVLSRTIVVDGLIVGFWEVDPRTQGAVWHTFDPAPKALATKLDDLTEQAARFIFDELGNPKTFTLDTIEEVQARADRVVALRSGKKPKAIAAKIVKKPKKR
jgi:winged helix DNA-binding protein